MRRGETVAGRVRRGGEAGRGAVAKLLLAGALMRMAGVFLAEMQLAVRTAANGRARRGAEASGRGFRQASARLATACTPERPGAWLVTRCTMGEALHDGQAQPRQGNRVHGWQADAGLLLFGRCAEGVHLVYYFHWDAEDSVQLFVCGGIVVAEEPYYCNELVVGYLTEWLVVSLV